MSKKTAKGGTRGAPAASPKLTRLRGVPHGSTHEDIYERLKHAIMSAVFVPGQRLVVADLERVFGTSAMPIREALRRLVAEQALENNPNRGVVVPKMTPLRLVDLRRVRCEIEGKATEWAATTITEPELGHLAEVQGRMMQMARGGDASEYLGYNLEFHFAIYRAARSQLLMPIIESLWMQAGPCLNSMRSSKTLGYGMDHHEGILAALQNGDGPAARAALEKDISDAADIILRGLDTGSDAA